MGYAYPIDSKIVTNPNGTIDYDRASSSTQLRGLIKSMITNGVNLTESTNLQVMAEGETMNVIVKPGFVILEGTLKHFEDDVKVKIANADSSHPRIDTVVARLNLNEDVRDIVIDVLQGTPSANPTAPELSQNTSTYYEVGLADILVEVGATQISQDVVTDTRLLNSRCGLATSIGEIDTETLFVQLTTDFDNWFEGIKGKLGDDVAGGLQLQIDGLADDIDTLQDDVENITPRVETLESRPTTLLCTQSEVLFKEVECDITLPSDITGNRYIRGMVYHDGKIYALVFNNVSNSYGLYLYIYNGESWTTKSIFADTINSCSIQELNGEIYYTYAQNGNRTVLCKYDNGNMTTMQTIMSSNGTVYIRSYLAKDYDNNILYWVYSQKNNSATTTAYSNFYYTIEGTNLSTETTEWLYASNITLQNTWVKDNKLYIDYSNGNSSLIRAMDLLDIGKGTSVTVNVDNSKKFHDEFIDLYGGAICHNGIPIHLATHFEPCDDEVLIVETVFISSSSGSRTDYTLKKIKLYRKLQTYAKTNDIIQCDNSFAISDNLEAIDNGYRVTADGEVQIGVYL